VLLGSLSTDRLVAKAVYQSGVLELVSRGCVTHFLCRALGYSAAVDVAARHARAGWVRTWLSPVPRISASGRYTPWRPTGCPTRERSVRWHDPDPVP
jgi:hypothetical protein